MKRLFFILVFQYSVIAFAQLSITQTKKTVKETVFSKTLNTTLKISQVLSDGSKRRELIPYVMTKKEVCKQYLLNEFNSRGVLVASQYIISKTTIGSSFNLFQIPVNSQYVLYYDALFVNNKFANREDAIGKTMVRGTLSREAFDVNTTIDNPAFGCNSGSSFCIDWYWQVTVNGVLVSEEYVYTTCLSCSASGGSSGTTTTSCQSSEDNVKSVPASLIQSTSILQGTTDTRTVMYSWIFCKQVYGLWSFTSHERGTHRKVGDTWVWESLVHESISKQGGDIGFVNDCKINYANPTLGQYFAVMTLNYTITSSFICNQVPINKSTTDASSATFSSQYKLGFPISVN